MDHEQGLDTTTLTTEVDTWCTRRNTHNAKADRNFTIADAREKLTNLDPALRGIQTTRKRNQRQ